MCLPASSYPKWKTPFWVSAHQVVGYAGALDSASPGEGDLATRARLIVLLSAVSAAAVPVSVISDVYVLAQEKGPRTLV